jgi:hypothetical protein
VGEREYLLPLVRGHSIWRSRRLWEDSLMLSVADSLELCPQVGGAGGGWLCVWVCVGVWGGVEWVCGGGGVCVVCVCVG